MAQPKKQALNPLITPIVGFVLWSLLVVGIVLMDNKSLFESFTDFGLKGSWHLFTVNLLGSDFNGVPKTLVFLNGTFDFFLMYVGGSIFLFTSAMVKLSRVKEKRISELEAELAQAKRNGA